MAFRFSAMVIRSKRSSSLQELTHPRAEQQADVAKHGNPSRPLGQTLGAAKSRLPARRVCFPFFGQTVGGSHLSALLLARHLQPPYEPLIVVHEDGPLAALLREQGIDYVFLPIATYVGSGRTPVAHAHALARTAIPLMRLIKQDGIALVHAHDGKMNQTWALPARLAGVPFIWHQRTDYARSRLSHSCLRISHRILCVSQFTAARLPPDCGCRVRIVCEPFENDGPIFDRERCRQRLVSELDLRPETRIIGFFGNLTAQKRPLLFIEAIARLRQTRPGMPLGALVFGERRDDWDARMLASAASAGVSDSLRFMGFRHPIANWMAVCDLVLCPGINEGFGRTVVEAMLAGTPVVAARSGGHMEIIGEGEIGLFPVTDDAEGFAEAALRVLEDPDSAAAMAARAQAHARAHYSVAAHVRQVSSIYDELVRGQA